MSEERPSSRNIAFKLLDSITVLTADPARYDSDTLNYTTTTYKWNGCIDKNVGKYLALEVFQSDWFTGTSADGTEYLRHLTAESLKKVVKKWPAISKDDSKPSISNVISKASCSIHGLDNLGRQAIRGNVARSLKINDGNNNNNLFIKAALVQTDYDRAMSSYLVFKDDNFDTIYSTGHPGCVVYKRQKENNGSVVKCPPKPDTKGLDVKKTFVVSWEPALDPILLALSSEPSKHMSKFKYDLPTKIGVYLTAIGLVTYDLFNALANWTYRFLKKTLFRIH